MNEPNHTAETTALLEKLEQSSQIQQHCAKRQSTMMIVAAIACVGIFLLSAILFVQMQPVISRLNNAAEDLTDVTRQLAAVDIESTVDGLNKTMASSQQSLNEGAQKLEQLDIETLNAAIEDLYEVVAPLSRLFGGR